MLYIFPDTNLFIQCKSLEDLDWVRWKDSGEVHLIVSRAVQAEIDRQKDRGNDRLGRKARATSALFREVILSEDTTKVIQHSNPRVVLNIRADVREDAMLADRLDYRARDDQLIGIACSFSKDHPGHRVILLTHDTGPMAAAKTVGLEFEPIPDDWLLPAESSAAERKIALLENELQRLRNVSPQFQISFRNGEGQALERWDGTIIHYPELSREEIEALAQRLQDKFPMETDFTPPIRPHPKGSTLAAALFASQPPTEDQIRSYCDRAYPDWVIRCKRVLSKYHRGLRKENESEQFEFLISNRGLTPAKDALVTIRAQGNCFIRPPFGDERQIGLSLPPEPPRHLFDGIAGAAEFLRDFNHLHGQIQDRDPNMFFWKDRSEKPSKDLNLQCEQWRHDMPDEIFTGNIEPAGGDIAGALTCEVRAENLPHTAVVKVPIRLKVAKGDTYGLAMEEIDGMELLPRADVF